MMDKNGKIIYFVRYLQILFSLTKNVIYLTLNIYIIYPVLEMIFIFLLVILTQIQYNQGSWFVFGG